MKKLKLLFPMIAASLFFSFAGCQLFDPNTGSSGSNGTGSENTDTGGPENSGPGSGSSSGNGTVSGDSTGGGIDSPEASPENLITEIKETDHFFAYGDKWNEDSSSTLTGDLKSGYTLVLPKATQFIWQAQLKLKTNVKISKDQDWRFSVNVKSNVAMENITLKLCDSVTENNEDQLLYNGVQQFSLAANKSETLSVDGTSKCDLQDILVVFDFGGNPAATIEISDLAFYCTPLFLDGYHLVWSDEFTSCEPDGTPLLSNWGYDIGRGQSYCTDGRNPNNWAWGNEEDQWYSNKEPKNTFVSNGTLKIRAIKETGPDGDATHTSGRIVTRHIPGRQWKYGYIEMRAKIPTDRGVWPAFWMLDNDIYDGENWPDSGEIDIMESSTSVWGKNKVFGTLHCKAGSGDKPIITGGTTLSNIDSEWHTYAVEWTEDYIKWYYDEKCFQTYIPANKGNDAWPFCDDFYIIINLAVGGNLGGDVGDWNESTMTVDYVRVWQKN